MKSASRRLMWAGFALLWVAVTVMGLELFGVLRSRAILQAGGAVPAHPGWNLQPPVLRDAAESRPEDTPPAQPIPVPSRQEHLGALFGALSEADRALYARLREELIIIYDRAGRPASVYVEPERAMGFGLTQEEAQARPLTELCAASQEEVAEALASVFEEGRPAKIITERPTGGGTMALELAFYPLEGGQGAVCTFRDITHLPMQDRLALAHEPEKDPLWKEPWLEYRPNVTLDAGWKTNNVGFRDDDVMLPKPEGVLRVACVGGSTTIEGGGNAYTYPNLLEQMLRDRFKTGKIEVVNCGVGGIGSIGERKRALDYVLLEPDLVIHYNFVNDLCHGLFVRWKNEATPWQRFLRRSHFLNLYANTLFIPSTEEAMAQLEALTFANLRTLAQVVRERGMDMAFCSFACPDYGSLSQEERDFFQCSLSRSWQGEYVSLRTYCRMVNLYNARLLALCKETGAFYIPLAEQLRGGTNYFVDICHMQPAGIARKAEILAEELEDYVAGRVNEEHD